MSLILSPSTIAFPLLASMRKQADRFAQEQPTTAKSQQVYRNTLAVLVVEQYLNCMEIPSQLELSRSWNPIDRLCSNVSDLYLTSTGRLECCPVEPGQTIVQLGTDRDLDRMAYVWVELNLETQMGQILGYLTAAQVRDLTSDSVPYHETLIHQRQFNSLDELPQVINLKPDESYSVQPARTRLSQWLNGEFEKGWQAVDTWIQPQRSMALLFNTSDRFEDKSPEVTYLDQLQSTLAQWLMAGPDPQSTLAYRGVATTIAYPELQASVFSDLATIIETTNDEPTRWRAAETLWSLNPQHPLANSRRIRDLDMKLQDQHLGLMIAVLQAPDYSFSVLLRLYPLVNDRSLPLNLKLEVCSIGGQCFVSTHSRRFDSFIQLCFNAIASEEFCVNITHQDQILQEYFII